MCSASRASNASAEAVPAKARASPIVEDGHSFHLVRIRQEPLFARRGSSLRHGLDGAVSGYSFLIHIPAVANHQGLASERIRWETSEEQRNLGDILDAGEFLVDRLAEHDLFDNFLLRNA